MISVKFLVGYVDDSKSFVDEADVESAETAKEEIEEMVKMFNEIESSRFGKDARLRKLIKIIDDE